METKGKIYDMPLEIWKEHVSTNSSWIMFVYKNYGINEYSISFVKRHGELKI